MSRGANLPGEALKALKKLLKDRFLTKEEDLYPYSFDASSLSFRPGAIALPEKKEEVLEILYLADKYEFYVTCRGAGTSTTGSSLPISGGLVVSFAKMNRILELNLEERIVRVEPGVINGDLKSYLKKYKLFYPPDPASYKFSTIGGNVATGAGGPRGLKYGTTKDYVLALEVGLVGGKLLKTGKHTLKGVVPYNLTSLMVGSEGTLGIFTEIILKVIPFPERRVLFLIFSSSEERAIKLISEILLQGLTPSSAEFVDKTTLEAIEDKIKGLCQKFDISLFPESLLWIEFDGAFAEVEREVSLFLKYLKEEQFPYIVAYQDEEIEGIWEIRRGISPSLKKLASRKIADDVVVPRRYLIDLIKYIRELEREEAIKISAFGHAGDGNLHINLLYEEEREKTAFKVRESILKKVLELCGTISGEHGVGYLKRPYVVWELDELQREIMRKIKDLFDPKGLLNPQVKIPD